MKICVVTGGGLGVRLRFTIARQGHLVWVTDIDESAAMRTADVVAGTGGKARPLELDVTDREAVDEAFARVVRMDGRIDGHVNSAGIGLVKPRGRCPARRVRPSLWCGLSRNVAVSPGGHRTDAGVGRRKHREHRLDPCVVLRPVMRCMRRRSQL